VRANLQKLLTIPLNQEQDTKMLTTTSHTNAGQDSVLSSALLDQYRGRKNNLLGRLIDAYLQEAPTFYQNIRKASETGNLSDVRAYSHALKSCSYNLGATRLSKICQDLETAALENNAGVVAGLMQEIGPEWFEAEQALRTELFKTKQGSGAGTGDNQPGQSQGGDRSRR
jgi:HPt (histidine-containing phosphotransfer) domain-containing protein